MENGQDGVLKQIADLNRRYEINEYSGQMSGEVNFEIYEGRVPVLVSAPHAVKHLRKGKVKLQDGMTGGIVEYLIRQFELYGIVRVWNAEDDPNFADNERSVVYRDAVVRMVEGAGVKLVFDIHGCRDEHDFDMDIGINGGGNIACDRGKVERMAKFWRDEGLDVRIDEKFRAKRANTVSNYVHRATGVDCLQLELAERVRRGDGEMKSFLRGFEKVLGMILAAEGEAMPTIVWPT